MISFFTVARAFCDHFDLIQRNALQSWMKLHDECEVLLIGEEGGSADVARELGLIHVPEVARNEYGSALVNDVFAIAHTYARHNLLCYVSADIVLMQDFILAARQVNDLLQPFLMGGRRWNLDVVHQMKFEGGWEDALRREVHCRGRLESAGCVDYLLFTRGLLGEIPPFAIGRKRWDRWVQYRARCRGAYIDVTEVVTAVHQNHGYGELGYFGHKLGPESLRNIELAGDQFCDLRQAPLKLTRHGIRRAIDSTRLGWQARYVTHPLARQLRNAETVVSERLGPWTPRRALAASKAFRRLISTGSPRRKERIAVVGLTDAGLWLALNLASGPFTVVGVDANVEKLVALRSGRLPSALPALQPILARCGRRLTVQRDVDKAISKANVIALATSTRFDEGLALTPERLLGTCGAVGRVLGEAKGYRLVVVIGKVQIEWMRGLIRPTLERISGRKAGRDFGLCYWPWPDRAGDDLADASSPVLGPIRESDPFAGRYIERLFRLTWGRSVPIKRTNLNDLS